MVFDFGPRLRVRALICSLALALSLHAARATAQSGVSDDRVSLPSGPGSLEGIGENVGVNGNMGTMGWSVPVQAPAGFSGMTPSLGLSYSSGGGGSAVGMGWSMDSPSVERMTYRGLPRYTRDDDFAAGGGSQQLVRVPGTDPPVYRARFEGGFVRWSWLDAGDGSDGYWKGEYPDGRVGYFGARADGTLVSDARVDFAGGTFRYMLVELVDVHGHRLVYTYGKFGNVSLVQHIGWVFQADGSPRYSATFAYEERRDDTGFGYLSNAKCGFNELLTQRLKTINILSGTERIRRYELSYEPYADSGGFTRLSRVEQFGLQDGRYPVVFDFGYSKALGGLCDGTNCERPFLTDMGSVGVDLGTRRATLLDINGDALPDLVHTPLTGNHRIFFNASDGAGASAFAAQAVTSTVGTSSFVLGSGRSQVLDVNGDGFVDLLNTKNGEYLRNDGGGDWAEQLSVTATGTAALPDFESDFDPGDEEGLQSIRFMDYDNDKKIDVIRATGVGTSYYHNVGAGGFAAATGDDIGAGFLENALELADMNGDGLLDVVQVLEGQLRVKLNFGWGTWDTDWKVISNLPITLANKSLVSLQDINGDALADLVIVAGETVTYALNRNAEVFQSQTTLDSDNVDGGAIPNRLNETTVLYADMNGNGSDDVVWVTPGGHVTYLELFPVRPNLLSRVENGLGAITEVEYGTSVEHMARDGGADAWPNRLPHPMLVVDRITVSDALTGVKEVTDYRYHDGFYDGIEKRFRGYGRVEAILAGDASQEPGLTISYYDVGDTDPYRRGLLLRQEISSDGRPIRDVETTFSECAVDAIGTPGATELPIKFTCPTRTETVAKEGADAAAWATIETERGYDGYGNVVLSSNHGVTAIGGAACGACDRDASIFGAPCGADCLGDERFTATDYVTPDNTNGRWILHAPYRVRSYGRSGGAATETTTYYDGPDFEGLALGQLDKGLVTRVVQKVDDAGKTLTSVRNAYDDHGNVIDTLDPLGAPGGQTHRRQYTMDAENLRVVRTDVLLEDADGAPYTLRQEVQYEPLFDRLVESTSWIRVVGGEAQSARRATFNAYDEFGRIVATVQPGQDTVDSPTSTYEYDLKSPVSRVITRTRSASGGALDLKTVSCIDGRGRTYQVRIQLEAGDYQVSGYQIFNVRGSPQRTYQPYRSTSDACDLTPPANVLAMEFRFDGTYRAISATHPDEGLYGSASTWVTRYEPLAVVVSDPEDTDASSPHTGTPLVRRTDGMGRVVAIERSLTPGSAEVLTLRYDELGRLRGYVDAAGNEKVQTYDLADRVLEVQDPNAAGDRTYAWDDADNLVTETDGRGVAVQTDFDGMNRPVARWNPADADGTRIRWHYDTSGACDSGTCSNPEGRLVRAEYPLDGAGGVDLVGYDTRGRTILESRALAGVAFETSYAYDNANRVVSTTYPDGRVISYAYDNASRLTAIPGFVDGVTYDDRALMSGMTCANGVTKAVTYDARMRLAEATDATSGAAFQGFRYTRDRASNLVGIEDLVRSGRAPAADAELSYDAWYRLVEARLDPNGAAEVVSLAFDAIDNVVSRTSDLGDASPENQGTYAYDGVGPNAASQVGGRAMGYDDAGYLTQRGDTTLEWDFLGRLTGATRGGATVGRFSYAANQRRVMRVEGDAVNHYISTDFELRDGITSHYIRMGRARVARIESADLAARVLPDVAPASGPDGEIGAGDAWMAWSAASGDDLVGRLLRSSARRMLVETQDETTWLAADHVGSLTVATNAAGEVIGQRAFYASGEPRGEGTGWVDDYGFTGQERDPSTGLVHFDFRYLDTAAGRWASADPLFRAATPGNVGSLGESTTAYAYVANRWPNVVDPTGLKGKMRGPFKGARAKRAERREARKKAVDAKAQRANRKMMRAEGHAAAQQRRRDAPDGGAQGNRAARHKGTGEWLYKPGTTRIKKTAAGKEIFVHDNPRIVALKEASHPSPTHDSVIGAPGTKSQGQVPRRQIQPNARSKSGPKSGNLRQHVTSYQRGLSGGDMPLPPGAR